MRLRTAPKMKLSILKKWFEDEGWKAEIIQYEERDYYKLGRPRHFNSSDYEIRRRLKVSKDDKELEGKNCQTYYDNVIEQRRFDNKVKQSLQRLGVIK